MAEHEQSGDAAALSGRGRQRKLFGRVETGPKVIARILKALPSSPGVYRMIDCDGEVLYVGKARNLKKRVQSYCRLGGHTNRIARMISVTAEMEFVSTATETEALLLEANLIKRLKPRFNVTLRDDKSFPYILIARDHPAPQILKHRGARKRDGDYYGPFASAGAVNRTITTLQRAFLLRSCTDSYYEARTRPCLLFQIKRCSAPCTAEISLADYGALVDDARAFLSGESDAVKHQLHRLMDEASAQDEFERAASYRDRLAALSHIQSRQGINPVTVKEADVFAAHQEAGQTCVEAFFFRTGQNSGNRAYFPRADKSLAVEEVLDSFLAQFYDDKPPPRCILLSHEVPCRKLLAEALSVRTERKVRIEVPQRGERRDMVQHALINAREALARHLAESASQRTLLEGLAQTFGLDEAPERIEVYDNSHIQGASAVGVMIVAGPEGVMKNQYRKFNIRSEDLTPGDDYAMLREVFTRRFTRLLKESRNGEDSVARDTVVCSEDIQAPSPIELADIAQRPIADDIADGELAELDPSERPPRDIPNWPDLVIIDGGAGQLSAAHDVLQELGLEAIPVLAVAKGPERNAGRERFHMRGRQSFMLEPRAPVLYFVQRLRDEAHRFAVGSHRIRRKKAFSVSPLDEVPGIGPARKRALLKHFGSAKAVSRAGLHDLKAVNGISAQMAQAIYDFFHEQGQ